MAVGRGGHIVALLVVVENRASGVSGSTSPSALATPVVFNAPTIVNSPTVTPATISTPVTFQAPSIVSGVIITPSVMATPVTFNAPTIVVSRTVTPATIATPVVFNQQLIPSDHPFVTSVDSTGRYLKDQNGDPILVLVDWAFALMVDLSPTQQATYFANRQSHGVNAVVVALVCGDTGGINDDGRTYDGVTPFTNAATLAMRESYWVKVDNMLALAASYGITIFGNPLGIEDWRFSFTDVSSGNLTAYGSNLAARYADTPNLVWMLGIDYQAEFWSACDPGMFNMRSGLDTGDHLMTIQLNYDKSTSYDNSSWVADGIIDFVCTYTYWATYDANFEAYEADPAGSRTAMPVFFSEGNFTDDANGTVDEDVRRAWWWSMLTGAYAASYGNANIWPFLTGWDDAGTLNDPPLLQISEGKGFLEDNYPWWTLVPFKTGIITTGRGTYHDDVLEMPTDSNWAAVAQTPDKLTTMAYFPDSRTIAMSLTGIPTPVTAFWYDPTSGDTQSESNPAAPTHPGANDAGAHDWVLVIEGTTTVATSPSPIGTPVSFHAPSIASSPTVTPSVIATPIVIRSLIAYALPDLSTSVLFHLPIVSVVPDLTPSVIATPVVFHAPSVSADYIVTPATIATPVTFPAPSVAFGAIASPSAINTPVTFHAPTVLTGALTSPSTLAHSVVFNAPTILAGATTSPDTLAHTVSFPAPTLVSSPVVTPSPLAQSVVFPAPSIVSAGPSTALPDLINTPVVFHAPTIQTGGGTGDAAISQSVTFNPPTVSIGSTVTPSVLSTPITMLAASVLAGTVVPGGTGLSFSVTFNAPTFAADVNVTVTPSTIALTVTFHTPNMGALKSPPTYRFVVEVADPKPIMAW